MPKPLSEYTDLELKTVIRRYVASNRTTGAAFPLSDFVAERDARKSLGLKPLGLALNIVRIARQSDETRAAYSDVWHCYHDGDLPQGNNWMVQFRQTFDDLARACVVHALPAITTLVVEKGSRDYSDDAINNLWTFALEHGVAKGTDPAAYVRAQAANASRLSEEDIRAAFGGGYLKPANGAP